MSDEPNSEGVSAAEEPASEPAVSDLAGPAKAEEPASETPSSASEPPAEPSPPEAASSDLSPQEQARLTYPELTPCGEPILLAPLGFGTSLWGRRDERADGSYIATHCLVALLIPVFALGAYRITLGGAGSWRFLGRSRLSGLARVWNVVVALAIVAGICSLALVKNDHQLALAKAKEHQAAQRYFDATRGYLAVVGTSESDAAIAAITALIEGPLQSAETTEVVICLELISCEPSLASVFGPAQDAVWTALCTARAAEDPEGALRMLDALEPLAEQEVAVVREKILLALNQRDPTNPVAASGLAQLYERRQKPAEAWAVLQPAREKLGTSEGARILGALLLVKERDLEGAAKVWGPYVAEKLAKAQLAQTIYTATYQRARDRAFQSLTSGQGASEEWYRDQKAAPAERRNARVSEWVHAALEADVEIKLVKRRQARIGKVLPIALELAIVRLALAERSTGGKRFAAIEDVERLLIATRESLGATPRYKLTLAKVHYQLGRPEQGEALLIELEEGFPDEGEPLIEVALAYRQANRQSEARRVAAKAFEAARGNARLMQRAARLRAALSIDLADRVVWLERTELKSPQARAALASTRAEQAELVGDLSGARQRYREAVREYEQAPEIASLLLKRALVYRSLWRLGGSPADLTKHLDALRKASALQPTHPLLLQRLVNALQIEAGSQLLAGKIDLARAKQLPSAAHFWSVVDDSAGHAALSKSYLQTDAIQECNPLLRKLLSLAPDSQLALAQFFGQVALSEDPAQYEQVLKLIPKIDFSDYAAETIGAYHSSDPEEGTLHAKRLKSALETATALEQEGGATYALALASLVRVRLSGRAVGQSVDVDRLLAEAERAHAASPSITSRFRRIGGHAIRALARLAKTHPALAEASETTRRSLDAPYLLAHGIKGGGPLAEAIAADPDVIATGKLLVDLHERAPGVTRLWWAVLLRGLGSPAADSVEEHFKSNRIAQLRLEILLRMSPLDAEQILEQSWFLELSGQAKAANELLAAAREEGVPLP
ncbi:MAG: hypothetical protein JKY65_23435 [Planctomycetes bacterium]|nr:hypothetical protein [Planctomycetota bacterium]